MDSDICESHAKNKVTNANSHLALAVSCDAQHKVHCSPFPIQFIGNAFSIEQETGNVSGWFNSLGLMSFRSAESERV